jgi:hypothetical protein
LRFISLSLRRTASTPRDTRFARLDLGLFTKSSIRVDFFEFINLKRQGKTMKCEHCETSIPEGEAREHLGRTLCEDCYMDALSPAKTCDPWAVHSAKTLGKELGGRFDLTALQKKILEILQETGGAPPERLVERLNISPMDLEREISALRHMEKVRGELRDGKKYIRLW